mmetsp:Transcript_55715/g.113913  ORF Transcript_55715/g.113913 Transcript_55715/m.113913 type:complete len:290 (+) Transcript_55715:140-1009(+)|eukprot:CAMPEP_0181316122 /NCGR_PEP_ID=MMETSP1101-20121128/15727_1 /TAXON_ID=46948 /ORGANISM="Rhodomonas abbreviata, Strain Caron Lab Isolate" /LENGTH=289 /DNA_ID=CAMNT_0023423349 /DNA_START=126 /DNA_END=995 /DNA_ORIENTATION=+
MSDAAELADDLVAKAEKKLKGGMFGNLFGSKKEEAVDILEEAANKYKQAKRWASCGETHKKRAELQIALNDKFGAGGSYQAAFQAYKKDDGSSKEALECLNAAIELFVNNGRFTQVAKFHKEAGEMFEAELNYKEAIKQYQSAADYYKGEDQTSSANQCLKQVGLLSGELEDYATAIEVYESIAASSLDVALLKWGVKDYFFQAGLYHLATADTVAARRALDRYKDQDVSFKDHRECKLLEQLVDACDEMDVEALTEAIAEFDEVSKLDKWKTTILLRIKNKLKDSDLT